jgi:hypothetical protein
MNFLYILLSIYFSVFAPSFTNNGGQTGTNQDGTIINTEPGGTKKDKTNNGDFIISNDSNP